MILSSRTSMLRSNGDAIEQLASSISTKPMDGTPWEACGEQFSALPRQQGRLAAAKGDR
jgi:hypothetical protein